MEVDIGPSVKSLKKAIMSFPCIRRNVANVNFPVQKTNLCQVIRSTQGKGLMPDSTSRFSIDGKPLFHYMGTSTFSSYTVVSEIALAKIREGTPFDKVC